MSTRDVKLLRDLARQYLEICHQDAQQVRRKLWRRQNSLIPTRPLIYVRAFAWPEMPEATCTCKDPLFRRCEDFFRQSIFRATFEDDFIFEPWVTVNAAYVLPGEGIWGPKIERFPSPEARGAWKFKPPIVDPEDTKKLIEPHHVIDERETRRRVDKLSDAIGDLITVNVDRAPLYRMWNGDISTQLANIRGLEQIMWDMYDRPEWLHQLCAFMRDGILQTHKEAEQAGDWTLCDHQNQAMPYAEELDDPAPNSGGVMRDQLWYYAASQELAQVGPKLFDEFMLHYQLPIMAEFGLVAYGCCEDLTHKIDVLRQIPNLRRIAVSPFADAARCAEQIGTDYVLSYRPSPADMVSYGYDPDRIRSILRRDLIACKECHTDVTLKDVQTVQYDPTRVGKWVQLTRQVIDEIW
jgi:hypothetical protein